MILILQKEAYLVVVVSAEAAGGTPFGRWQRLRALAVHWTSRWQQSCRHSPRGWRSLGCSQPQQQVLDIISAHLAA